MAKIKIIGQVFTTEFGVLNTGDVLACSDEFAQHLQDIGAGEIMAAQDAAPQAQADEQRPRGRGKRA